jgi:hypothetical protein
MLMLSVHSFSQPAINMGRKRTKLSTICHVKESVVQASGDLRTLHSNLMKSQADHIIYEQEQVQSQIGEQVAVLSQFKLILPKNSS